MLFSHKMKNILFKIFMKTMSINNLIYIPKSPQVKNTFFFFLVAAMN